MTDLEAAAREAWADLARTRRWTLWARLSWASPVSEVSASRMLERWADRMRAQVPGAAMMVGLHDDTERRHAHALLFIPKRVTDPVHPPGVSTLCWCWAAWLNLLWKHGEVWADWFSPGRTAKGRHGAAEYMADRPGTVMQFGLAPQYVPRRSR